MPVVAMVPVIAMMMTAPPPPVGFDDAAFLHGSGLEGLGHASGRDSLGARNHHSAGE
jgi:hypothetical protein